MKEFLTISTIFNIFMIMCSIWIRRIGGSDFMVMAAQCESSCIYKMGMQNPLSLMQKRTVKNYNRVESLLYSQCFAHSECLACVKPCSQPFSEFSLCLDHCKGLEVSKKKACMESCAFLRDININKVGNCPSVQQMSGFALACIESCQKDSDCGGIQKCCAHRCGRTCQYPDTITEDVPPKPIFSVATKNDEKDNEGRTVIRLEWMIPVSYYETSLNDNVSLSSILYVIQSQINVNPKNEQPRLSEWRDIAITGDSGITLKEHLPGSWIRFRVASINPNGTLGYSEPSAPIMFTNGLNAPEMPINLTIGEYTIGKNGKINQVIHWSHPKSDLPIVKYKISWSQNVQTSDAASSLGLTLQQFKKVIKGDITSYTIDNLEPETTYFIQLQAYSQKDDLKLRGEKASIFLTTPNLYASDYDAIKIKLLGGGSKAQGKSESNGGGISKAREGLESMADESKKIILQNISVGEPYYQNGLLKAKVQWKTVLPSLTRIDGKQYTDEESRKLILDKFAIKWHAEVCIESMSIPFQKYPLAPNKISRRTRRREKADDSMGAHHASMDDGVLGRTNDGYDDELDLEDGIDKYSSSSLSTTKSESSDGPSEMGTFTKQDTFTVYDLKFECRYAVVITPIYKDAFERKEKLTFTTYFQTPICSEVSIDERNSDNKGPDCPITTPPPGSPQNLTSHVYYIDGSNITTLITWRPPNLKSEMSPGAYRQGIGNKLGSNHESAVPNPNVIGYRLVFYGKRGSAIIQDSSMFDPTNSVSISQSKSATNSDKFSEITTTQNEKTNNVLVKVFSPFQTSFHVSDLLHDRDYAVDIQAFSEAGPGEIAHLEFRTPEVLDQLRYIRGPLYQRTPYDSRSVGDNKRGFANFKEPGNSDAWKKVSHQKLVPPDASVASRYFYYSSADNGPYGNVRYSSHPRATPSQYKKYLLRAKSHSAAILTHHISSVRLKILYTTIAIFSILFR